MSNIITGKFMDQAPSRTQRFWYAGSAALSEGYAMCYNSDYGTATDAEQIRMAHVEPPTQDNNRAFAGVTIKAYAARSGGQEVELYLPGSVCPCYVADSSCTLGDDLTFYVGSGSSAGAAQGTPVNVGQLSTVGYKGRGTVTVMQTLSSAGLALCYLQDGQESGMCEKIVPAVAGGAVILMVGGRTYVNGATVNTDHITFTIAVPVANIKKGIYITDTVGNSKNLVVTFGAGAIRTDKASSLATATFNTAAEVLEVQEYFGVWQAEFAVGVTQG